MLANTNIEPFSTKSLVNLPDYTTDSAQSWHGFVFESELQNDFLTLVEPAKPTLTQFRSNFLVLDTPNLPDIDLEPPASTPASPIHDEDARTERDVHVQETEPDLWNISDLLAANQDNKLISWDHFSGKEHEEPIHTSACEAGSGVFDLLLQKVLPETHDEHLKYAKPNVMVNALFDLGLGRSSVIFQWSEQNQRFEATVDSYTVSGLSQDMFRSIANQYLDAGAQFRKLRIFAQSRQGRSPMKIALHTAVKSIITVIEESIESARHSARTLVRLQDIYNRPFRVLNLLDQLATEVRNVSDDCQLTSAVLRVFQRVSLNEPQFEKIAFILVSRMVQPILRYIEAEVGFANRNVHFRVQENLIQQLLQGSVAKLFQETKNTLQVLSQYDPPFLRLQKKSNSCNRLRVELDLGAVALIQKNANSYEQDMQKFLVAKEVDHILPPLEMSDEVSSTQNPFSFHVDLFTDLQPRAGGTILTMDGYDEILNRMLTTALVSEAEVSVDMILTCPQAIDLSLTPFLKAQHRLLSYSALQILFQDHGLIMHTNLLGRFQLLGDGTFTSKLSISLFDSGQASGEGRRRKHTKTGLRLQSRETWPPASSELRLALMGILSESMLDVKDVTSGDAISFAIRDLSDEDLEKCRDIDSIYALDFLRLDYKPPTSLVATVITSNNLEQYDRIFNQLLRLLRMKALTQSMLHATISRNETSNTANVEQKFRIEAQRFVSALADYCQGTIIKSSWFNFEGKLNRIFEKLNQNDFSGTLELAGGLDQLQAIHNEVLDKIMRGLLLKRRQSEPKGIIDRLFEVILRYAALTSSKASVPSSAPSTPSKHTSRDTNDATNTAIPRLRKDFEMHMKALVGWLRVESGRAGNEGSDMFEQLLLRLDWNGYWSR